MTRFLGAIALSLAFVACTKAETPAGSGSAPPAAEAVPAKRAPTCVVAGCSKELCLSEEKARDLMSTCEWKEEYRCFQMMTCEAQANGECGFTPNEKSEACLKELPPEPPSL